MLNTAKKAKTVNGNAKLEVANIIKKNGIIALPMPIRIHLLSSSPVIQQYKKINKDGKKVIT